MCSEMTWWCRAWARRKRSPRRPPWSSSDSGFRASWRRTDMDSELTGMTAAALAAAIAAGEVSAAEVTEAHLARIGAVDTQVHAFLHVAADSARAAARAVDER